MSNSSHHAFLVFTAGPVQGFVGQARRTRDLWAGSWLLSYLSESALIAAEKVGGTAVVPYREKPEVLTSETRKIGGIPNRFELGCGSLAEASAAGKAAVQAFQQAWLDLCEQVWGKYLSAAEDRGNGTAEIWNRQTRNFWELSWVVAESKQAAGHLAAGRKGFRNSPYHTEAGYKCSLMGTHQELSGQVVRDRQKAFWEEVRLRGRLSPLEIAPNEHLCAISLVKRLFPKVHPSLRDPETVSWPSTSFIAALPWLKSLDGEYEALAQEYAALARTLDIEQNERSSAREFSIKWANVDAQVWFKRGLERNESELDKDSQKELLQRFGQLKNSREKKPLPMWALLLMDGDSLGALLSKLGNVTELSRRLAKFADRVEGIVLKHNGKTVYAGGDDVLAMLPAESAVEAAAELSRTYRECFRDTNARDDATISAAIIYAPLRYPFQTIVKRGHELLDDVAKDQTGRDALAIDIVLGSGLSARWSAPWSVVLGEYSGVPGLIQVLPRFRSAENRERQGEPTYNASFLYSLRTQFVRLFPELSGKPGEFGSHRLDEDDGNVLADIANAEYRRRLSKDERKAYPAEETRQTLEELMWLSRRYTRNENKAIVCDAKTFSFDGWRVARFLQQVKEGDLGEH